MKENVRNVSEKQENMRLNTVNSKKTKYKKKRVCEKLMSLVKNIFYIFVYIKCI